LRREEIEIPMYPIYRRITVYTCILSDSHVYGIPDTWESDGRGGER